MNLINLIGNIFQGWTVPTRQATDEDPGWGGNVIDEWILSTGDRSYKLAGREGAPKG